ncbi:hypothetical protein HYPSUDRAFT_143930 [Hypholoma sublateritium FD-334 SS-4]|uniref:GST N-terminal domain-containing protein n=1 Tax=Hypholoma sublateritium (strain FD-334 SS-4) TaxID=945553 RepID=A0A0D2PGV7_HYPSF|nr:hypothetical protein HYPSUDRAFT_143930 [Hypholoma sublateritium FD-334 SS-4]
MTITLFDLPSTLPIGAWSPNTWKTRFALNYQGIPYVTEWVEWPDIEPRCIELGIPPTAKKANGSARYTLPAIHDPATGVFLADSLLIAEYLAKTYPDAPALFPNNTLALQVLFSDLFRTKLSNRCILGILSAQARVMLPRSAEAFRTRFEAQFGARLEDLVPRGEAADAEWAKFEIGIGEIAVLYTKTEGPFLMGNTACWADLVAAAHAMWWRTIWGEESDEWARITAWHGGLWSRLLVSLKDYQQVV